MNDSIFAITHVFQVLLLAVALFSLHSPANSESSDDYRNRRNELIRLEKNLFVGGVIVLNADEKKVNDILMQMKGKEIDNAEKPGGIFPPSVHFFKAKPNIERSKVFQMIQTMPKGGLLHIHDMAISSIDWLIKKATYRDDCYMCVAADKLVHFKILDRLPTNVIDGCEWITVNGQRKISGDSKKFDKYLYEQLSLVVADPLKAYPTLDAVWKKFMDIFISASGLISSAAIFKDYVLNGLEEMRADNVQYCELRALLLPIYDLDGTAHDIEWTLQKYIEVSQEFTTNHPADFLGMKIIYISSRRAAKETILAAVKDSVRFRRKYPSHFSGYDIVGQEDKGNSLLNYIDAFLWPSQNGEELPYFFHCGETDWQGLDADRNLIDALLLNSSRIGHGYALTKHPLVRKLMREKNIAVEVNPISNQVLKLVDDLRNHPAADLIASGHPVVISSDDPVLWGATSLSHDFYEAFMGLGGGSADLATLKKLAINSVRYSAMSKEEKVAAFELWHRKWQQFIAQTLLYFSRQESVSQRFVYSDHDNLVWHLHMESDPDPRPI